MAGEDGAFSYIWAQEAPGAAFAHRKGQTKEGRLPAAHRRNSIHGGRPWPASSSAHSTFGRKLGALRLGPMPTGSAGSGRSFKQSPPHPTYEAEVWDTLHIRALGTHAHANLRLTELRAGLGPTPLCR